MIIQVKFEENSKELTPEFGEISKVLGVDFGETQKVTEYIGGDPYNGDYIVTPKVKAQTLPTKNKVMNDDVTINSVPFFNVSNISGGNTIYIASEV